MTSAGNARSLVGSDARSARPVALAELGLPFLVHAAEAEALVPDRADVRWRVSRRSTGRSPPPRPVPRASPIRAADAARKAALPRAGSDRDHRRSRSAQKVARNDSAGCCAAPGTTCIGAVRPVGPGRSCRTGCPASAYRSSSAGRRSARGRHGRAWCIGISPGDLSDGTSPWYAPRCRSGPKPPRQSSLKA